MNVCQIYRKHGEKIRAFTSVTDRGGHSAVTVRGFTSGLGGGKGRIIGTPRASGDCVRSTDSRGMKAESMLGETAGKKWDRAMEIDCSGYFKAARPAAPAIKDRNYDKNIHVTSTNDVRSNFGRSNDFTSKAENIGHLKALPMDRRIPHVRAHVATHGCSVAGPPTSGWIHRTGAGAGLVVSIGQ